MNSFELPEGVPKLGERLAGRYELKEVLGEGGMGIVYRAIQHPLARSVAVKVLLGQFSHDPTKKARFMTEARILAKLRGSHTVSLIDFGVLDDGIVFIVMEYLEGGTLRALMDQGPMAARRAYSIVQQILRALAEAHAAGIIHRDLKPGNVLIDRVEGERLIVRVTDFGIAKWNSPLAHDVDGFGPTVTGGLDVNPAETAPGIRLGTPEYIPPEQAFAKGIDHTVDLYALGVIFYEMLLGAKPFAAENAQGMYMAHLYEPPKSLRLVAPQLNVDVRADDLILSLMQKKPGERPQSAKSVLRLVDELLHQTPLVFETSTEMPALNPVFANAEDTHDEPIPEGEMSHSKPWMWLLAGVVIGLGVGGLLFG